MSKKWKPNPFKYLEKNLTNEFLQQQEKKLDSDHNWNPNKDADLPINEEYAIGQEILFQDVNKIK